MTVITIEDVLSKYNPKDYGETKSSFKKACDLNKSFGNTFNLSPYFSDYGNKDIERDTGRISYMGKTLYEYVLYRGLEHFINTMKKINGYYHEYDITEGYLFRNNITDKKEQLEYFQRQKNNLLKDEVLIYFKDKFNLEIK